MDRALKEGYADQSYHGFEEGLIWRYEDLRERWRELSDADAPAVGEDHFSREDDLYAPTDCFWTLADVYRAMETVREVLEDEYGIVVREDGSVADKDEDEDPDQITVFDYVLLPTWFQTAVAA